MNEINQNSIVQRIYELSFSKEEALKINEVIDFIVFQRVNSLSTKKDVLLNVIKQKGYESLENLIKKIRDIPFHRTSNGYIKGFDLKSWLTFNLDCSDEQALEIINLCVRSGLMQNSGFDNYW